MTKIKANNLKKITTYSLKEYGFLGCERFGELTWTYFDGDQKYQDSIGIEVSTIDSYLRVFYTITDIATGETKDIRYEVHLVRTRCFFGGYRFWFECPLKNRKTLYCGRRVGVLYKVGDLFGCRHCHNLTYASRNLSGDRKRFRSTLSSSDLQDIREKIRGTHYKGKPTKRFLRYMKKEAKAEEAFGGMIMSFKERLNKILEVERAKNLRKGGDIINL